MGTFYSSAIFIWFVIVISGDVDGFTIRNETELRTQLFSTNAYDVNVRPSARVTVQVLFNLLTINELNIRDQTFKVSGWLTLIWRDKRLSWNGNNFGDVRFIFATEVDVWRPALIVSNSVENLGVIQDEFTPFRITSEGKVIWEPPGIYHVNCEADITYYPFDSQECFITLQSWSYNLKEVNITQLNNGVSRKEFRPNGEWDFSSFYITNEDATDAKGDDFSQIKFHFKLDRKTDYYWLNVLLPVIVNSILTALVFALPAESGEKMGYSLTVLLSFMVLLTLISDKIPSTSIKTSLIVVYFAVILIMGAGAVLLSTISLEIYFRPDSQAIPKWTKYLTKNFLAPLVCYKNFKKKKSKTKVWDADEPRIDYVTNENSNRATTIKRQMFIRQTSELFQESVDGELNWRDISRIWDIFFLRLYLLIITGITVGFLTGAASRA